MYEPTKRIIYRTKDYSKFKILHGNRDYKKHGEKLLESIREYGIISPIVVNENYEIIDGQGRFYAAKKLGLEIPYIFKTGIGINECISMNQMQTNWNLNDYIKSYAEQGNEHYKKLLETMEQFPDLDFYTIAFALGGKRNRANKKVMDGTFQVEKKGLTLGLGVLSSLSELWQTVKMAMQARGIRKEIFCQAVISIWGMPGLDREHLLESIRKHVTDEELFPTFTKIESGLKSIEDAYNYRLGVKSKKFFCEYHRKLKQKKMLWWDKEG